MNPEKIVSSVRMPSAFQPECLLQRLSAPARVQVRHHYPWEYPQNQELRVYSLQENLHQVVLWKFS